MAFVTPPFLSLGSTESARNAWDHVSLLARKHEKEKQKERKRNACIFSLVAKVSETNEELHSYSLSID